MTHWKQKLSISTSSSNEHCQCMQNESQRCKVKVVKCHFIILWRSGVIEEKPQGGGGGTPPSKDRVIVTCV